MRHNYAIPKTKTGLLLVITLFVFIFSSQQITAQSIPGTGTSAGICGNCNPTGWADADPLTDGTPDISNRNQAGGEGTYGAGATWTAAPLPLPPTGDVRWITLRDVGTSGSVEENVTTTMTGLVIGKTYKLVINTMTSNTNLDGGVGGNEPYGGVFIEDIDIQVGSNPRRTLIIPASSQNAWGVNTIIFIAEATSETFTVFPGADSNAGNVINDVEMIHLSVDGVNALEILDTDGDGIDDAADIDDDNDGILDSIESGGFAPNADEDGDGIANYQDVFDDTAGDGDQGFTDYTDANSDGFPDAYDFDGDGVPNHLDLDSDNDGILDNVEAQTDAGFTAFTSTDTDGDGLVDVYDTTPSGTSDGAGSIGITPNAFDSGQANDDTTPDYLDIDTDDDGIPDNVEAQTTLGYTAPTGNVGENGVDSSYENVDTYTPTGITIANTDIADLPDYRDSDSDNDGTTDINENGEGNTLSGTDTDGDGLDNNFDADNVNYDVNDNIATPSTDLPDVDTDVNTGGDVDFRDDVTGIDSDGDKIPDSVDLDDDNDGITDSQELCGTSPASTANSIITVEINFDTYSEDITWNLRDPSNTVILTEGPYAAGISTDIGNTVTATTIGNYTLEVIDSFGDGFTEADGDGISFFRVLVDGVEVYNTTSALGNNPAFTTGFTSTPFAVTAAPFSCINGDPSADDDSDGTPNYRDADYVTGVGGDTLNANGTWTSLDHDGDGVPDHIDLDSDNDGITDNVEAQTTAGYIAPSGVDTDSDGLDDAYDTDCAPCGGVTGAEIVPANTDTDSDTRPDYKDIDSDNDGIPDNVEAQTTTGYTAPNGVPGANGLDSAYDFTDAFSSTGLNSTLIDTDGVGEPDYRDTDSDGDGTLDANENGITVNPGSIGTDTDNDGLDDIYEGASTNDIDPNDEINTPSTNLLDADADVNTGGDVDYRDTLAGQDTDGDGIVDSVDIDDDNDGIIDTVENTCADGTTVGTPFTSLGQARAVSSAGVYFFNLNGNAFSTYVDSNGYVQIAVDFGNGSGDLPQGTSLTDAARGILTPTVLATLTDATSVRISHSGGNLDITTTNATILSRITTNTTLHQGTADNTINNDWTGTEATAITVDASCTSPNGTSLHQNIAHLCGNTSGFHWLPAGGTQRIRHSAGSFTGEIANGESFTIWVQAASDTSCSDFDGDGIPNSLDQDSDGDGILDVVEAQITSGYTAPTGGVGANGLYDIYESDDTSGATGLTPTVTITGVDVTPDYLDIDTDDDGIPDNVEAQTTQGYTAPSGNVGLNGVDENYENNDTFTATGLDPNNNDNADEPDYRDTDSDNDGTTDADESGITLNGGSLGTDSDGDGLDDIYEGADATSGEAFDVNDEINDPVNNLLDADGDGSTTGDVDYRDDTIFIDTDGDGVEDSVDLDDDNDGILDTIEDAAADADSDGIPNRLDIDSDNDGIPDNVEAQSTTGYIAPVADDAGTYTTNNGVNSAYLGGLTPVNTDDITGNNTDTLPDYLDPDSDGDGINDILENGNANTLTGTDTDGDGYDDAFEGVLTDADVNDDVNTPSTDLPDIDGDVNTADGAQPDAAEYNDVDYRDIDDDRAAPSVAGNILWLRADIGVTGVGEVTNWADQSGSGFNATNTGTGPAKLGDGVATDGLNFNPTLQFTEGSSQDLEIGSGGILGTSVIYDHIWVYGVSESNSATNASFIFSNAVTGGAVELQAPTTGSLLSLDNATGTALTSAWGGTANAFNIWNGGSSSGTATPSTTNKAIYRDGLQIATNATGNAVQFTSNNSSSFIGSDNAGANFFDGQIAEVMVFNTAPTSAEQQKIQSYLAIKYGITLDITDNDATIEEGDYVIDGSPDVIVWDQSANSAYHNDVAGIGRDDGKFLNQKQSRSINTTSVVTIGLSNIEANNASNSNTVANESFLMWGHNGVTVNNTNTSAVTLLCENELQLDRKWKVIETGTVGTVEVAAVQATIDAALTTPTSEVIVLKVADDADFTTNVKHIPVTTRTINGTAHYVATFNFDGTKYFTYSEVLGIFWNGDAAAWTGGAGTSAAPAVDAIGSGIDGGKVLVIDAETSLTNATMTQSANVGCLWVKANSKLVVSTDLFIEFDQDFILDGEIRLIGDAQLVQSHTGLSNVTGSGVIYRDQASNTPSVYRYNYWGSPVVAALGNTTYSTSTVMFDGTTPTSENSVANPIVWQDYNFTVASLNSSPTTPSITIATWWIYAYFNGVDRTDWVQKLSTGGVNIGEGFIMKSTGRAPQNFTFVGSPNDGTISKTLTPGTTSLLGNPYPSVINTQQFITDNDAVIDGTLYFWEHQGETSTTTQVEGHGRYNYIGGYSQRNSAMGVAANAVVVGTAGLGEGSYSAPPQYIAVGQGFFVSAPADKGGVLSFANNQRDASTNNTFFRNSDPDIIEEELPNFKLGMDYVSDTDANIHRQLGVNFKEGATFEYESGFDSRIFDLQPTDIYWDFEEVDSSLIIAGVGELSSELQIPLGINVDTDFPVSIIIDEKQKMEGYTIYLGDLVTGRLYNLDDPVELSLPKGTYTNRFVIFFGGSALSTEDNPLLNGFNVFRNNTTDEIIVRNNNGSTIKKVEVFNTLGQQIKVWKDFTNTNEERFYFNPPSALYIVKVTTDKGKTSKKIIVD